MRFKYINCKIEKQYIAKDSVLLQKFRIYRLKFCTNFDFKESNYFCKGRNT